jgi:hypothetical protein
MATRLQWGPLLTISGKERVVLSLVERRTKRTFGVTRAQLYRAQRSRQRSVSAAAMAAAMRAHLTVLISNRLTVER